MLTDTIKLGETYDITLSAKDADDVAIVLDGTWAAACRITRGKIDGETVAEPAMTIAAGVATTTLDTGGSEWTHGEYYYDVRLTDADGNDFWTDPVKLKILNRNAPASS